METKPALRVYKTSWCPDCRRAEAFLRLRGIPFEEIDIEEVPGAAELVMELNEGRRSVPTLVAGDHVINASRFNPRKFEADLVGAGLLPAP